MNYASGFRFRFFFFFPTGGVGSAYFSFFYFASFLKDWTGLFLSFSWTLFAGLFFSLGSGLLELLGMGAVGGGGFIAKRGRRRLILFLSFIGRRAVKSLPLHPILSLPLTAFLCFYTPPHSFISSGGTFSLLYFPFFFPALTPPFLQLVLCRPCLFFFVSRHCAW